MTNSLPDNHNQKYQPQKFRIPKFQLQANDQQLTLLRKKILAHYYDRQISQHKLDINRLDTNTSSTGSKSKNSRYNPQQSARKLNYIDYNNMEIERQRQYKQLLAKEYQNQMARKLSVQKIQKQVKLEQEKKMIESVLQQNKKYHDQQRQVQLNYRKELLHQVQQQKQQKLHQKQLESKQKQEYHKKYNSVSPMPINRNYAFHENSKLNKFKQHYDHVNKIQFQIESNYVKNWSPMIKQKQHEKDRLIQEGISRAHGFEKTMALKKEQSQQKFKNQFKQALEKQIKQKQDEKYRQKTRNKSQTYIQNSYKNLHHPICNPVDFKMAHDNKKILRQLKQEQQFQNKRSGLARNGSIVILPHYITQ